MDSISYEYTKQRREFGLHPQFGDSPPNLESVRPNEEEAGQWLTSGQTQREKQTIKRIGECKSTMHNA
jgi:hypothetical protein